MVQPSKVDFRSKYKAKGAQQVSYKEYLARQEKAKNSKPKIPSFIKYILMAPLLLVGCFGLFFIPFLIFKAITSPAIDSHQITQKSSISKSH